MSSQTSPNTSTPEIPPGLWELTEQFIAAYQGSFLKVTPHTPGHLTSPDVLCLSPSAQAQAKGEDETIEIGPSGYGRWVVSIDASQMFFARTGAKDEVLHSLLTCLQTGSVE